MKNIRNRRQDLSSQTFMQTQRFVINDFGIFYKVRGGKLHGPFASEVDAKRDLSVFMQVLKIESELERNNFQMQL
ncbi:DUF6316 family protein [Aliikangiella sp. IMCC44653]